MMSALPAHADQRDPRPRSGRRIASANNASRVNSQAPNKRLFETLSLKPAKPRAPNRIAAAISAATTKSNRVNRDMLTSPPRQRPHGQQQSQQRDAEKEADVGKIDRTDREGTEMH